MIFTCFSIFGKGQNITLNLSQDTDSLAIQYVESDIDGDKIMDSLYYDFQSDSIMVLLSTHDFKPFGLEFNTSADIVSLSAIEGYFTIHTVEMNTTEIEDYAYEKESKRFRLVNLYKGYPDVYGYTEYSLDLLGSEYSASFSRYDEKNDSIREYSDIRMVVDNDPIYWGDFSNLHLPGNDFFNEYVDNYDVVLVDTLLVVGVDKDYDIYSLMGVDTKGVGCDISLSADTEHIYKGDLVLLHSGMCCRQEPGDGNIFYARQEVFDVDKIEDGALSKFYQTNKKEIEYFGFDEDGRLAVDYFLANTKDKKITKYLKSSGKLRISQMLIEKKMTDYNYEGDLLIEIVNDDKDKETFVCKLILDSILMRYGTSTYYIWDAKTNDYKKWVSDLDSKYK